MSRSSLLRARWLGRLPYAEAWDLQRGIHEGRVKGRTADDYLLLVEHPPVFTIGRNGDSTNLLADREAVAAAGAEVFDVDRGGDITFHGPGQLVGYPILDLDDFFTDIHKYLRYLGDHQRDCGVWSEGRPFAGCYRCLARSG